MRFTYLIFTFLLITCSLSGLKAQKPVQYNSSETYVALEKLNTLLSVLYVAAHPDDENQRIISYCANTLHANTAYLSLTRGDGGQNLIGTEIGPLLGVLRSEELLGARSIDGGQQYFTRAIDFGYSKHPDETFEFWNKDQVTSDVVRVIRQHRPDIIINRFDHRSPGKTHGHHTASAMLGLEAFDLSNDASQFPNQLSKLAVWQPSKIYFNTSWWFYGSREKFAEADKTNLTSVDIGGYYPLLGKSNNEIAAYARSMHKCQGFGSGTSRSSRQEYLELIKTANPELTKDLTQGINTTWTRVKNGEPVGQLLTSIIENYDFRNPTASLNDLVQLYTLIEKTDDEYWKAVKLEELQDIIQSVTGLYLEATTETQIATSTDSIEIKIEATNRSEQPIELTSYQLSNQSQSVSTAVDLGPAQENIWYESVVLDQKESNHYWLNDKSEYGTYYAEEDQIGKPKNSPHLTVDFVVTILNQPMTFSRPVMSMDVFPDKGEVYNPLALSPPASVSLVDDVYIFAHNKTQEIAVNVESMTDGLQGNLTLQLDKGWKVNPSNVSIDIKKKSQSQRIIFEVTPPNIQSKSSLTPTLTVGNQVITTQVSKVNYDHIPNQVVIHEAKANAVKLDIKTLSNKKVAYLMGAGDQVPDCLEYIGYTVEILDLDQLNQIDLNQYQAVILGIRIYNVNDKIEAYQDMLFDYAAKGGNLITQYNTSRRLKAESLAPVMMEVSRDRVSDETAPVTILEKDHPALTWPNQITDQDFEGWVQERGLYFPDEFDESLVPLLKMSDKGENDKYGSLLVMQHGDGYFVYTGLSFFRELPAGVPGPYRLMANLISLGSK